MMLWDVVFSSSYYDNDPRMPGDCSVTEHLYILGTTQKEVLKKAEPLIQPLKEKYPGFEITTNVIAMENLVPAIKKPKSERGLYSQNYRQVSLDCEEDRKKYELVVSFREIKDED